MNRSIVRLVALLAIAFVAGPARGQELSLEEELAALQRELDTPRFTDDPFAEGRVPDLVILSTSDLRGEVRPCG